MALNPTKYNEFREDKKLAKKSPKERLTVLQTLIRQESTGGTEGNSTTDGLRVHVTGLVLDLLSLRPEICCVIEVPHAWLEHVQLNEEADVDGATRDALRTVPSQRAPRFENLPPPTEWVPTGYAAIKLAHEAFSRGLQLSESNSSIPRDVGLGAVR